jgi:hypothetical protein
VQTKRIKIKENNGTPAALLSAWLSGYGGSLKYRLES